ncbi:MAG: GHKL domain-containing protein [Candidatus Aminicenantes bacterium]|nr:MAG: GHKL domain-containing protein [Candidatus Aminicenantes bacterium]
MLDNLKIAVKRQKKLIIIFLITIFLPSIALSVFGVRSIRNERFRLVKQLEDEHKKAADFLTNQISSRFADIEIILQNLAQHPSFNQKNYASIEELLNNQLRDNHLIEHVFLAYKDEEPLFPLFLPFSDKRESTALFPLESAQREKLERAQSFEFRQKKFSEAVVLYKQIFSSSKNINIQAQMLNNIARCYMMLENYDKAIQNYSRVCQEYPRCQTSSLLPLDLIARIQIVRCYRRARAHDKFLKNSLNLYRNLLQKQWYLDADQFSTYTSMVEKDISEFLSDNVVDFEKEDYSQEFDELKGLHQNINEQWQVVKNVKDSILPELQRKFTEQDTSTSNPFRHSRTIGQKEYLILAAAILSEQGDKFLGLLGAKINNDYLLNHEINSVMEDFPFSQEASLTISTLIGQQLLGNRGLPAKRPTVTEYFKNNFPPWRVEFFTGGMEDFGIVNIKKNFYFLTILTILVLLTFGTVLVVRTIAHEMEVLRIKSDFVSSVSHEFKTPITSIKALIERLQQGKVKSSHKKKEYYSVISQDADKLSSLVRNILDFSKVEEGQKEYIFQETDVTHLIKDEIENFRRDIYAGIKIESQISLNIPRLYVDRAAFSLALNNLLENAVKFSLGKKEIFVKVRKDAENIIIEIEDKGMGVSSSEMDKIFDRFYQGKNATQQSIRGTGLGLTLVKHVMDAHEGKVLVKSKIGQGSTFSLVFPIGKKGSEM